MSVHAAVRRQEDGSRLSSSSYAVSSYVPNLAALLALHGATQAWAVSDLRTCLPFNNGQLRGRTTFPGVDKEAGLVASILSQPEGIVTTTQFAQEALHALTNSHIFHYVGHGRWGWASQGLMNSAFMLDTELKICDIIHAPLRHPVLAYLPEFSTCSSGPIPGLATGMLLSGFKSIVTTTWCVTKSAALAIYTYHQLYRGADDKNGPVLAEAFYRSWLTNGRDGLVSLQDIPYALDDACAALGADVNKPTHWKALVHIGA
jgi:hypothetical protein